MNRFHVYFDRADVLSDPQLMTEPLDLVGSAGTTSFKGDRDRARYEVYSVEVPGWMDVIEFRDWARDHYRLTRRYGALNTWSRHTWVQLRKMLPEPDKASKYAGRRAAAICYLLKANLRRPERIAAREMLKGWIDREVDFEFKALPDVNILDLAMSGYASVGAAAEAWHRVNPDYPWYSAELESHQAALVKVAERMRDLVREAEAQRIRYAPRPISTTEDDLAALGDVF